MVTSDIDRQGFNTCGISPSFVQNEKFILLLNRLDLDILPGCKKLDGIASVNAQTLGGKFMLLRSQWSNGFFIYIRGREEEVQYVLNPF